MKIFITLLFLAAASGIGRGQDQDDRALRNDLAKSVGKTRAIIWKLTAPVPASTHVVDAEDRRQPAISELRASFLAERDFQAKTISAHPELDSFLKSDRDSFEAYSKNADREAVKTFAGSLAEQEREIAGIQDRFREGRISQASYEAGTYFKALSGGNLRKALIADYPNLATIFQGKGMEKYAEAIKNDGVPILSPQEGRQKQEEEKVAASTARAIAKFPDCGKEGTPLFEAVAGMMEILEKQSPEFFANPNWPEMLATTEAAKLRNQKNQPKESIQPSENAQVFAVMLGNSLCRAYTSDGGYRDRKFHAGEVYEVAKTGGGMTFLIRGNETFQTPTNTVRLGTPEEIEQVSFEIKQDIADQAAEMQEQRERNALINRVNQLTQDAAELNARQQQLKIQQQQLEWQQRHPR